MTYMLSPHFVVVVVFGVFLFWELDHETENISSVKVNEKYKLSTSLKKARIHLGNRQVQARTCKRFGTLALAHLK